MPGHSYRRGGRVVFWMGSKRLFLFFPTKSPSFQFRFIAYTHIRPNFVRKNSVAARKKHEKERIDRKSKTKSDRKGRKLFPPKCCDVVVYVQVAAIWNDLTYSLKYNRIIVWKCLFVCFRWWPLMFNCCYRGRLPQLMQGVETYNNSKSIDDNSNGLLTQHYGEASKYLSNTVTTHTSLSSRRWTGATLFVTPIFVHKGG